MTTRRRRLSVAALVALLALAAVSRIAPAPARAGTTVPHVMVVMLENQGYTRVIGSSQAPFINSLARTYGNAVNWYGVTHPSLPNYLALASGSTQGTTTDCFTCGPFSSPSLGGQLSQAGIPWAAYEEDMPTPCDTDSGSNGYDKVFNPWVYFSDVLNDNCASHVLPFTSFQSDLSGPNPPDFVWVGPNINDNMHSGTIAQGDQWLQSNVGPILSSSWFTGAPSTLIITMDEHDAVDGEGAQPRGQRARADVTDGSCCDGADGGHVVEVVVSPKAYGSHTFTTAGDHYGTLRAIEEAYGLPLLGGARNTINGDLPLMGAPGPDSWTGPLPLNGQTNAAADAPVAGNWGTQQVLFYDTTGQHLAQMWRNTAGGAWSGPVDFSAGWNNPNANIVSQPSLSVTSGAIILYWQGANGHLWTLSYSYSKGWQGPFDVSAAWTNPNAMLASAPSAVITSRQELVYYTGNNGDVWETWYTFGSGWAGPADLTGGRSGCTQAASAPVAAQYSSQQVVFFQGPGNALCETWYPRSTGWGDPAYITQPDSAASGLDGAPVISVRFGALLLFWRGQDNHLWEAWYSSQWSGPVDISGSLPVFEQGTSLPPGSEDVYSAPSVMLTPNNAEVVTWTDASGNICQAWYGTGWSEIYSPSQQMGAGSPASAVTTAISPYGDRDVFWQDATQRLNIGSYLAGNAYTAGP